MNTSLFESIKFFLELSIMLKLIEYASFIIAKPLQNISGFSSYIHSFRAKLRMEINLNSKILNFYQSCENHRFTYTG